MQIIKDKKIVEDDWQVIRELEDSSPLPQGKLIIPFTYWQANRETILKNNNQYAVWIDGTTKTETLQDDLQHFSIIALDFPAFKDGRSYSHARLLRQRYGYRGELRAIGDVLRDQIFFMARCGINSFQVHADKDIEDALNAFNEFSVYYQTAADDAVPVYKLR